MTEESWSAETGAARRIMVVDDDRDFADTLARLLDLEGYEVGCAYSIADALDHLERFPAEVALVDIRMGESSGLTLVAALRRQRPEVICVMMTAYSSVPTAIAALQEGVYDYLRKPFYSEHLMATLDRCFERIALARAREQAETALRDRNRELEELNQRLERAEAALRQRNRELELLNARLRKSVQSMRRLAAHSSLRELAAAMLEEVAVSVEAECGLVYLEEGGQLLPVCSLGSTTLGSALTTVEAEALCRDARHDAAPAQLAFPLIGEAQKPIGLVVLKAGTDHSFTWQDGEIGEILTSFAAESIQLVQALERLAASEERLRDVIDNSPSSISLKDLSGRFVIVNKRFEEWYGRAESDVAGRTSLEILPEDIARFYTTQWEAVLNRQDVVEEEVEVPFTDGRLHSVLVTTFPVFGAMGRPTGVGTIATDITDSRRAEEQLRQAQKTEALGQLAGGIAHDINNLLAVISGNLQLMRDDLGGDRELAELLEDAMSAAQSGAELTYRLLAFGRRQTLHPEVTDAGELVMGLSRMLERTLGETIETRWVLNEGLWPVEVDRNQLETSLLNLAFNARDAMVEGGVLTIEMANVSLDRDHASAPDAAAAGRYVVISVVDTGTGMLPETVERAIQPFFTTKQEGYGSGLGLSMVYGFAKQSGGHLEISSVVGQGTVVRLYLPSSSKKLRKGGSRVGGRRATHGSGETVLVVEDKANVRRVATRILSRLGYQVLEAADARTALQCLDDAAKVDLLFTDVLLPGGQSGVELAREARARLPELKVLFTSGYANNAALEDASLDGEVGFIRKPFAKEALARVIRQALEGSARTTAP